MKTTQLSRRTDRTLPDHMCGGAILNGLVLSVILWLLMPVALLAQPEPPLPDAPLTLVGRWSPPENYRPQGLVVDGNYAYVRAFALGGPRGLDILNITNPTHPTQVCHHGSGWLNGFVKVGRYGYGTFARRLDILDLDDPATPIVVGFYEGAKTCYGVDVAGDYAYVGTDGDGVLVLDVRDPCAPALSGRFLSTATVYEVLAEGGHLFVIPGGASGGPLEIYDLTNPVQPSLSSRLQTTDGYTHAYVDGNLAYLNGSGGLSIVDVTQPSQPVVLCSGAPEGIDLPAVSDFSVAGHYAFSSSLYCGLICWDVSNPVQPTPVACRGIRQSVAVQVRNNLLYLMSWTGLHIFQLPEDPLLIFDQPQSQRLREGRPTTLSVGALGNSPVSYQWYFGQSGDTSRPVEGASSTTLILAPVWTPASYWVRVSAEGESLDSQTASIELVRPVRLQLRGQWRGTTDGIRSVFVADGYGYVLNGAGELDVIDLSDPTEPLRVAGYINDVPFTDVEVVGDRAYLTASPPGLSLTVLGVSDPLHPFKWATYEHWGDPPDKDDYRVSVSGDRAYLFSPSSTIAFFACALQPPETLWDYPGLFVPGGLASRDAYGFLVDNGNSADRIIGVKIYDFTDPSFPTLAGSCYTPSWPSGISLVGEHAYVACQYGLQVIDLSNLTQPVPIAGSWTDIPLVDVSVSDGFAYAVDEADGLHVFDVTYPARPARVGRYDCPGSIQDLHAADGRAYVVDDSAGLLILEPIPALVLYPPTPSGDGIILRWTGGPGILLQQTAELSATAWEDVPGSEGLSQLQVLATPGPSFFRLRMQPEVVANQYALIAGNWKWHEAKADAESRGGHLATITSAAEWTEIKTQLGNLQDKWIWIGATDELAEGSWQWVTGESWDWTHWGPGEPNNQGNEDFAMIDGNWTRCPDGGWNDGHSGYARIAYYLLETEGR